MLPHNVAGANHVALAFDLIRVRTHIKIDPLHAVSMQLTKHLDAISVISKLVQKCTLDAGEHVAISEIHNLINIQIETLLESSSLKYDVMKQVQSVTDEAADLLRAQNCEILCNIPGELHVRAIQQKELFAINKILEAKHQTILLRSNW